MDINNYIRLLEAENKRLEEVNTRLLQENEALRKEVRTDRREQSLPLPQNGHSSDATCSVVPATPESQSTSNATAQFSLPFSQVLSPHFAGFSQLRPAQRKEIASAVRAFLVTKLVKLEEGNGEPAVPKHLEKDFLEWFAIYNEAENNRVTAAEKRSRAQNPNPKRGSSPSREDGSSDGNGSEVVVTPWTDLVRSHHPGATIGPRQSQFAKDFRLQKKITTTGRCTTGQIIMGIPPEYETVFLEAFRERFLPTGRDGGSTSEQDEPTDTDYQPRKRKRTKLRTELQTKMVGNDVPDPVTIAIHPEGPSQTGAKGGAGTAQEGTVVNGQHPAGSVSTGTNIHQVSATGNSDSMLLDEPRSGGADSEPQPPENIVVETPLIQDSLERASQGQTSTGERLYTGGRSLTSLSCSLSSFIDVSPTPPPFSGIQKRAYWTYLVKRWFPGYHETASESEQKRLRELTRTFLISKMGFDGGLYVPESLHPAFKEELDAYRRINLVSTA